MSEYEKLILCNEEDKTNQIESIFQENNTFKVKYLNSDKEYSYKDVKIFDLKIL